MSVKDKLNEAAYQLLQLPTIDCNYGEITFYNKDNIDEGQAGYRYNGLSGDPIDGWTGEEYVIVGYDSSIGTGMDPYIVKTDEANLPVYWLMTDGGDWSDPDYICSSLENFNKIINLLNNYSSYFENSEITEEIKTEILNEINAIDEVAASCDYWEELLYRSMPFE